MDIARLLPSGLFFLAMILALVPSARAGDPLVNDGKHLKNPARPETGFVSGLTKLTIRKLPPRP